MNPPPLLNRFDAATLLREKRPLILRQWEMLARREIPAARTQDPPTLLDNLPTFIDELAATLAREETKAQAPMLHAEHRSELREYSLEQVIREYHLLRRVLFEELEAGATLDKEARAVIENFLDLGIEEAATRYADLIQKVLSEEDEVRRHHEARYVAMLHAALDAIVQMDHAGKVVEWNPAAESLFGYARKDALGKDMADLIIPPALRDQHRRGLSQYLETGCGPIIGQRLELPAVRADGRDLLVELTVVPIPTDGPPLFTGYLRDITERRRMEEDLRSVLSSAECLLWHGEVCELESGWLHWTTQFFDVEGVQRKVPLTVEEGEAYGAAWHKSRLPEDRERADREANEAIHSGRDGYQQEFRHRLVDGRIVWFLQRVNIEKVDEKRWRLVGVCIDITERKHLELALEERAEALEEADRRKDQFLTMLAHELRNPLSPMLNAVHYLQKTGPQEPHLVRARTIIERQARHQASLINDLLDAARIRSGRIEPRPERLDLVHLVRETADLYRDVFEERGLSLVLDVPDDPAYVWADPTRMAQVMGNLLDNAGKFTPSGGRVTLRLTAQGGEARVVVEDTGIGIEKSLLSRVFDTFTQADRSLDRREGGLGLGLSLVKGLLEAHGGQIKVESEGLGRGVRFTITLPLVANKALAVEDHGDTALPPQRLRILIIEDNADAAQIMGDLLSLYDHEVQVAFDGLEGLKRFEEMAPDVVLCDIGLPGMDGFEVAREIRQLEGRRISLFALTGYGQEEYRRKAEDAGFDGLLIKPTSPETLLGVLSEAQPQNRE